MSLDKQQKKSSNAPLVAESILKRRHDLDEMRLRRRANQEEAISKKKAGAGGTKKAIYVQKPEKIVSRARSRHYHTLRYKRILKKGLKTKKVWNKKIMKQKEVDDDNDEDDHEEEEEEDENEDEIDQLEEDEEEEGKKKKQKNNSKKVSKKKTTITYQANSFGAPMVFVIRIRDHLGLPRLVKQGLNRLRLKNENEGVFVRYDEQNRKLLHLVEPWIIYGRPTTGTIKDLIERKGFGKSSEDGTRVPLSDNTVIEKALGEDHNIICIEDLVHELDTVGDAFQICTKFLWPFRLSFKANHFERKILKAEIGKDFGDKGEEINEYIKQML